MQPHPADVTWPGVDEDARSDRREVSVPTASLARQRKRLRDMVGPLIQAVELGQPITPALMAQVITRMIQHSQVYEASVHAEVAAANSSDAIRDIWAMRRQTEAATREAFLAQARSEAARDKTEGLTLVALEATERALGLALELERARSEAREARLLSMVGIGLGLLGLVAALLS